jgi:hypothetical protein
MATIEAGRASRRRPAPAVGTNADISLRTGRLSWRLGLHELFIIFSAYFMYFGVRGLTESGVDRALDNAEDIVAMEKALGIFVEPQLQSYVLDNHWIVTAANWIYIWGHWPVIFAVLGWLLSRHRDSYYVVRNAMIVSGLIGIVVFIVFPLAPPRLTDFGFADTVTLHSRGYRVLQPPAFVNQYAAMPSLHFGWDLLIGLMLFWNARTRFVRAIGLAMPVAMYAAIVLTANHYLVDGVVGGAVALTGLTLAVRWQKAHPVARRVMVPLPREAQEACG